MILAIITYVRGIVLLIKLEQSLQDLKTLEADVAELGDSIGADALGQEIEALEAKVSAAGF